MVGFGKTLVIKIVPYVFVEKLAVISEYIGVFSVTGLTGLSLLLIDRIGWKKEWMGWLIELPDLNGRYFGKLESSHLDKHGYPTKIEFAVEIVQNASSIHISSYYDNPETKAHSESHSKVEHIEKQHNGAFKLFYAYSNQPGVLLGDLNEHNGTASLIYYPDIKKLKGTYYNQRGNKGSFEATFESSKLLHRYD
jgi:hypothetical protein